MSPFLSFAIFALYKNGLYLLDLLDLSSKNSHKKKFSVFLESVVSDGLLCMLCTILLNILTLKALNFHLSTIDG